MIWAMCTNDTTFIIKSIKVEDADIRTHYLNDMFVLLNGQYVDASHIDMAVMLTEEEAVEKAIAYINAREYMWEDEDENASFYPKVELVICMNNLDAEDTLFYAAYKIDIYANEPFSYDYIYVNACNGDILDVEPIMQSVSGTADTRYSGTQTISTEYKNNTYRLRGYDGNRKVETYNLNHKSKPRFATDFTDNDNYWSAAEYNNTNRDNAALDAHWGAMMTYDYFKNIHNRDSYNNKGATIKQYVHYGNNSVFAGWNGSVMFYGDGNTTTGPMVCLDVVAHEIGHAVKDHSAKLKNFGEPGAINESLSDIWGACVENYVNVNQYVYPYKEVWLNAKELGEPNRSFRNPGDYEQPNTYGAGPYWSGPNANSHINSGIMNHWFYLLSEGGVGTNDLGNSYHVIRIGIDKAAAIVYRTETEYMTKNTQFSDARTLTIQAAKDLYGETSCEARSVTNAWYAVGVGDDFFDCATYITNKLYNSGTHNIEGCKVEISNTTIQNSTIVNANAEDCINIQSEFHVYAGSNFEAHIVPAIDCIGSSTPSMLFIGNTEIGEMNNYSKDLMFENFSDNSLQQEKEPLKINLYPNPNLGTFQLETNFPLSEIGNLKIMNLLGVPVYETQKVSSHTIQLHNAPAGQYFVVMILKDGTVLTQKMMVQ